jgi:hypothetical protein
MLNADSGFIDLQAKKALEREVETAVFQAKKNRRRALKLEAKLALAQKEAVDAGVSLSENEEDKPGGGEPE